MMPSMAETFTGTIERVTHHNPETGYAVLRVLSRGRRGVATVVGKLLAVTAGEKLEAKGSWVADPQYGEQFRADEIKLLPPTTAEGIEKYLASGLVKGIGPRYARKIVETFGERTLAVIDESPAFLKEIKGIGPARIALIRESWRQQRAVRDIMVFLQGHGLGTQKAVRIYKTYGDKAVDIVKEDPYRLSADIWGIGFATADELGGRLGIARDSIRRGKAAVRHILKQGGQEFGHVCIPEPAVVTMTLDGVPDLPERVVREAIEDLRKEGEIVREPGETPWLYLKPMFLAELGIARAIRSLKEGGHPLSRATDDDLARIERKMDLRFAPQQRDAVRAASTEKVLVVTGGTGVGKTTIVRGILELFAARRLRVGLCAPTGRAARRLAETTGREARTIHRLLEFDAALGGFKRTAVHPLDLDLLVIDECSMVDVALMNSLLRAVPKHACVVLVGDVDQLPSVGPGRVLADLIASKAVPVARLTEVFRQARESWIIRAAHAVREGMVPESAPAGGDGDFYFVETNEPASIAARIVTMVKERIPAKFGLDPMKDVQVLTPMNKGELGTEGLNPRLQQALNPDPGGPRVARFGMEFRPGDKVMQTQNSYARDVFNGDVGRVVSIAENERELSVDFDGRPALYDFGELDELAPAYAVTTHKAQGAEYPAVVVALHTQHFKLLQRNLLYTAMTRGKRLVVIVGSRQALEIAVRNQDTRQRFSLLARRLAEDEASGTA
ncbi:MAG: ATP-dependent RecD-like DNA helicase [Gemmataceae bacterium]|nr:ATP-dependent RecD-like DNA helicase [Gemmataceae bacterium]